MSSFSRPDGSAFAKSVAQAAGIASVCSHGFAFGGRSAGSRPGGPYRAGAPLVFSVFMCRAFREGAYVAVWFQGACAAGAPFHCHGAVRAACAATGRPVSHSCSTSASVMRASHRSTRCTSPNGLSRGISVRAVVADRFALGVELQLRQDVVQHPAGHPVAWDDQERAVGWLQDAVVGCRVDGFQRVVLGFGAAGARRCSRALPPPQPGQSVGERSVAQSSSGSMIVATASPASPAPIDQLERA